MAGILDQKTRVMDFILTDEGRRQIRDGDLRISFASFSDLGAFYTEESDGVASDAGARIYFEASSRHQDRTGTTTWDHLPSDSLAPGRCRRGPRPRRT